MDDTSKYLQALINQKKALANNLVTQGVEASEDEKFNTLIPKVLDIKTGGSTGDGQYRIRYLDIDGTILKEEYLNEGDSLTPPDNPSYDSDYLVFDSWNYDVASVVVDRDYDIGAIYNTIDNCTYMFCRFTTNTGLNPYLYIGSIVTVDWGDGTVDASNSHTYASEGEYIIKISGSFTFRTSSSNYLLGSNSLNKALTKYYVSNSITKIGSRAVNDCYSLKVVSIPNSVTSIEQQAFYYGRALRNVNIPNSVTSIGQEMFYQCSALQNISIPNGVTSILNRNFQYCYALKSICIPDSVTNIASGAFVDCVSLQSIVIPSSITSMGTGVFRNCYSLASVNILNSVTSIESQTFYNCTSLTNITIPDSVTSIGDSAFEGCTSLAGVILPESVTSIGNNAFKGCRSLTSVTILDSVTMPSSLTSIGNYAFNNCYALKSITIPNSVTSIGEAVFIYVNLTSIVIPKNVISIGSSAFNALYTLTNYFILCDQVPTLGSTISSINTSCIMWVNDEIYKELRTATNWSTYASYMKRLSECPQELLDENGIERPTPAPEPSGYTVEILNLGIATVSIYEGTSTSGNYLGDYNYDGTIVTSSEYLHLVPNGYVAYNDYTEVTGGVSVYADGGSEYITLKITGDGTFSCYFACLIEGTPITLSNNSTKVIEEITYEDELLVWDFDKGEFTSARPLWIMKEHRTLKYNHLVFSDGSELNTVNQHRIFNIEKGMFTYPMTDDTPIGTTTFNDKGEFITLVSKEVIEKEVSYYNIITDYHINLFAGTILTSCRLSNLYPIENMKYVKDGREIIPISEFNVPEEYYYGLRLGEQPVDINRDGAVSFGDTSVEDYVKRLISMKKE